MPDSSQDALTIYTVGHSNHDWETFLRLLRQNAIEVVIDTRSQPVSRYTPHFSKGELQKGLTEAGIRYGFYGRELGGRPDGAAFYDAEGHVLYSKVAESDLFQGGVEKVERGAQKRRVAMLCSEENPSGCHRHLLVGRVLRERGVCLLHIRGDGRLQTDAELEAEERAAKGETDQLGLFEPEEVAREWRSLQSVLPKRPPGISSGD